MKYSLHCFTLLFCGFVVRQSAEGLQIACALCTYLFPFIIPNTLNLYPSLAACTRFTNLTFPCFKIRCSCLFLLQANLIEIFGGILTLIRKQDSGDHLGIIVVNETLQIWHRLKRSFPSLKLLLNFLSQQQIFSCSIDG